MAAESEITPERVAAALRESYGNAEWAAEIAGCDRDTITTMTLLHADVSAAREAGRARVIDLAERGLIQALEAGEWAAIRFTLATLGRERGYVERIERDDTGAHEVLLSRRIDGLTDSELVEFVIEALYAYSKRSGEHG